MTKTPTVMRLRAERCAILPLVLKGKWYDMIKCGKKRVEYREAKPYWQKRILKWLYSPRELHVVAFSRGYRKPDMFFVAATLCHTFRGSERPDWGQPEQEHYKIHLLERVELLWGCGNETERPASCGECARYIRDGESPGHGWCDNWGGVRLADGDVCSPNYGIKRKENNND